MVETLKFATPEMGVDRGVAVAVMEPAPAADWLAAVIWMVATPEASVSTVPAAGSIVTNEDVVAKVTRVFGTKTPASQTVAMTLTWLPQLMY